VLAKYAVPTTAGRTHEKEEVAVVVSLDVSGSLSQMEHRGQGTGSNCCCASKFI